ncbi:hypothetical protein CBM2629_A150145 [Cupriavidus taiwanensis]|nr:hypothetical protein CBM2629_A150145 [Cupriavidus taiwanensis]
MRSARVQIFHAAMRPEAAVAKEMQAGSNGTFFASQKV